APLSLTASDGELYVNEASGGATVIQHWSTISSDLSALDFTASGDYVDVHTSAAGIQLSPFGGVQATGVDVSRTDGVSSTVTPGGTGTLYALTLQNLQLSAGDSALTLSITPGTASAYVLTDGSNDWLAIQGSGFGVNVALGSLLTMSASNVNFLLNTRTGGSGLTDWSGFTPLVASTFGSDSYFELDANNGSVTALSGLVGTTVTISHFKLVRETGSFTPGTGTYLSIELDGLTLTAGTGGFTLTLAGSADVYTFDDGTNSSVAVYSSGLTASGTIGPLTLDPTTVSFVYDSGAVDNWSFANGALPTADANTFEISGSGGISIDPYTHVTVGQFELTRDEGVTPAGGIGSGTAVVAHIANVSLTADFGGATLKLDGSNSLDFYYFVNGAGSWTAMSGTGFDVDVTAGDLHASASGATFAVNTRDDDTNAAILDWTFARGPPTSNPETFSSGEYYDVGVSEATLTLGTFVAATGGFDLSKQTIDSNTSVLTVSLTGVSAFTGVGAAIDGSGHATGTVGISVTGGSIDVAIGTSDGGLTTHVAAVGSDLAGSIGAGGSTPFSFTVGDGQFAIADGAFNWANASLT